MTTLFTKGQLVMVLDRGYTLPNGTVKPDTWNIGVVTKPTDPEYLWTAANVRCEGSMTSQVPGWPQEEIRAATKEDLDSLPDWGRKWVDDFLLERRNPKVPYLNRKVSSALRAAEIHRFEDLQQATDAELLALKGVGKKAVADLRTWQQRREGGQQNDG